MTWIFYVKTHFWQICKLFLKKIIWRVKGGNFKNGASHSDFMFVNIEMYPILSYQNIATLTPVYIIPINVIMFRCNVSTYNITNANRMTMLTLPTSWCAITHSTSHHNPHILCTLQSASVPCPALIQSIIDLCPQCPLHYY